jgi:hypothetical protein
MSKPLEICPDCTEELACKDCLDVLQEQESNYLDGLGI